VRVWNVESGKEMHPTREPYVAATETAFSPDGKTLATSARWDRNTIELYDTTTGRLKGELKGPPFYSDQLNFTSDGRLVGTYFLGAQVWDIKTNRELVKLGRPREGSFWLSRSRIAADESTLSAAAVDWDWSTKPGPPVHVVKWDLVSGRLFTGKQMGFSFRIP